MRIQARYGTYYLIIRQRSSIHCEIIIPKANTSYFHILKAVHMQVAAVRHKF